MTETAAAGLAPYVRQRTILLTSYRRDGTPVGTPVNIAVDGDRAYIRTFGTAWKAKRMRNNPEVEIRPSTVRGVPTGPPCRARARLLARGGEEDRRAAECLARKHPLLHGVLAPLMHRLRRERTLHYELRLLPEG
ncbi:PPOX class F420-dependent oxidoreductase [Streptomyces sp. NPDC049577]|uniref:PPOX class F420-dependent oxidoreductase n=1 Tax=Streptomyces sp. NPDC049577 TaxID=3155153 RepID=UPI0034183580